MVFKCSCAEAVDGACPYSNRCREPLAWSIDAGTVVGQEESQLFTTIPKELRLLIWEFALTNATPQEPNRSSLLQTCRAVYLETFTLPLACNPFVALNVLRHTQFKKYLPWQFASLQRLDVSLMQAQLEGDELHRFLFGRESWNLETRNKGVYIAPSFLHYAKSLIPPYTLVKPARTTPDRYIRLSDALRNAPSIPEVGEFPPGVFDSPLRVMLARPICHLTLRLNAKSWWTWTDDPNASNDTNQLGLDPTLGDGSQDDDIRPTQARMLHLADQRRAGRLKQFRWSPAETWGAVVGSIPGLQSLELVLETFAGKQSQLESVVECAKLWRFPLERSHQVLRWDGRVDAQRRHADVQQNHELAAFSSAWWESCSEFEVRTVRFVRMYNR